MYKFNPFTGNFDRVSFANFSFKRVKVNQTVCINDDQQMIVKQNMTIEGELVVIGELVII